MLNLLAAAALAAATPAAAATAAPAHEPALFVVHNANTTIFIFGTFHALDGKSAWMKNDIRDAFEKSDELVLETLVPEGPGPITVPREVVTAPPVTPSGSFLATTRMAISAGRSQGMQVDNGADMVLRHVAEAEGKPVEGLETLQYQLDMFNRMPAATTAPAPTAGTLVEASPMESLTKAMGDMQSAWKRGDQSVFVNMLGQLEKASPDTYRM